MTAAELQGLNQWQDPSQSILAQQYGWTPEEVQQLQARGIGPAQMGQMNMEAPNTLQMLRAIISQPTSASAQTGTRAAAAPNQTSYLSAPQINMGGAGQPTGAGGTGAGAQGGETGGGTSMATMPIGGAYGNVDQATASAYWAQQRAAAGLPAGEIDAATTMKYYLAQHPDVAARLAQQPETRALAQMAQIDPTSEALRQNLGQSYLKNLGGGPPVPQFGGMPKFGLDLSRGAAAPNTADVQSYLNLYKQIDPQGFAQRQALAGQMGSYLSQVQKQAALGAQLDPGTIREVEQGTRRAQAARGNVYGTPQLVAETMARGTAGEQRLLARQQMLGQALGQQQSYLTSGAGMGDVANQLYNQGYGRYLQGFGTQANAAVTGYQQQLGAWQAQQNARLQSQGAALGYLGSGQTPYQAGASYLNMAQQNAGQAAQGGPQYNPAALGQQYTGAGASSFPQYGLDMSQLAGNWYNNINQAQLQAYGLQQAYGQRGGGGNLMGAGAGALGGAASGALAGAAAGGIGAIPGAIIGGIGGAASGYFK